MDFHWLYKGTAKGYAEQEHVHDFDEFLGFVGSRGQEDPRSLGEEIEVWLGGEKHLITKSSLVWVPPGLKHCPLQINRIDSPILLFTIGMTRKYTMTPSAK